MSRCEQRQRLKVFDWLAFGVCLASFGMYPIINRLVQNRARVIPATWVDRHVPCWPWTTGVYVSLYPLLLGHAVWLGRHPVWFRQVITSITRANLLSGVIFLILPTSVPRPILPQQFGAWLLRRLWALDPPHNACPSLHTTYAVIVAQLHHRMYSRYQWGLTLWALAIVASTLTTRQHRLFDIAGGIGLAFVVCNRELCQSA